MKTIVVRTVQDFLGITSDSIVEFSASYFNLPPSAGKSVVAFHGLKNVVFRGAGSPRGRVCLTGSPIQFVNCSRLVFERIAFRLTRSTSLPPERYEKWWSSPRLLSTSQNATSDISFSRCSFSGNTDEIAVRLADGDLATILAATNIRFDRCVFGRSITSLSPGRGNHNFGLAASRVDGLSVFKCIFSGHNRRLIQLQGKTALISRCLFVDAGTMFIGLHTGSQARVVNNLFVRGTHTPARIGFVAPVGGTSLSEYKTLGTSIDLSIDNLTQWQPDDQPLQFNVSKIQVPVLSPARTTEIESGGIGVGDTIDKNLGRMINSRTTSWVADEPIVVSDYL